MVTAATTPRDTALRRRLSTPPRGLVVAGLAVPDWAARWCADQGRRVSAHPLDAVAVASRVGDSVLVPQDQTLLVDRPRIVAAVRALPDDAAVLDEAVEAAEHLRGSLLVLHGVPLSFGERTIGLAEALRRGQELLEQARALTRARRSDLAVETALVRAWAHELVGEQLDADLLVIGGARTATTGGVGLVAATAVHHAPCAVILAPRPSVPLVSVPTARGGSGSY